VARQAAAAPRRQARPKGSPGANKIRLGLFIKIIFKKVNIKKLHLADSQAASQLGVIFFDSSTSSTNK
jgi:hypothetical protein